MRIAVWLKVSKAIRHLELLRVSIRRADRCLVEAAWSNGNDDCAYAFQSAVRIAVWLKQQQEMPHLRAKLVSIRRADRCLVEARSCHRQQTRYRNMFQSAVRIAVWLKATAEIG